MFPAGPRRVSAAFTNLRSAVTVLIERDTVYRFRWNKKTQRFYVSFETYINALNKIGSILSWPEKVLKSLIEILHLCHVLLFNGQMEI